MKETIKEFEHFRLHKLENKKFKRCAIEIHFRRETTRDYYANISFLIPLIFRGTKSYPSLKELNKQKEYLYGIKTGGYTARIGKTIDTTINLDFLNPKYIDEPNYLEDIIKFLFDYLKEPVLLEKDFDQIRDEIKLSLKKRDENLSSFASNKAKKTLENDMAMDAFETPEEVDSINLKDMKSVLKDFINNNTIDIYVFGNLDMKNVEELLLKYSPFTNNKIEEFNFTDFIYHRDYVEKEDKAKFEQSMIIYYYSLENLSRDERLYPTNVLDEMLGGGLKSLLYKDIREKHSLCYNLYSSYYRDSNLLSIHVGVDKDNIKKTKERIEYIMNNLDKLVTEEGLNDAKLNIINGILTNTDSVDYLLFESDARFCNILDPIDVKIEKFKNVTLEDVKSIIPRIQLYTKYVLVGDKNENN